MIAYDLGLGVPGSTARYLTEPRFSSPIQTDLINNPDTGEKFPPEELLLIYNDESKETKLNEENSELKEETIKQIENVGDELFKDDESYMEVEITGQSDKINIYQARIEIKNQGEDSKSGDSSKLNFMYKLVEELEKTKMIEAAVFNFAQTLSSSQKSFSKTSEQKMRVPQVDQWTEPDEKKRWGQKAINLLEAWEIALRKLDGIEKVKMGILDYAYSTSHIDLKDADYIAPESEGEGEGEDRNENFSTSWNELDEKYTSHGSGVFSIVGADGDNDKGMAGMIWQAKFTCYGSYYLSDKLDVVLDAIDREIRVLNVSMGPNWGRVGNEDKYCERSHKRREKLWRQVIEHAKDNGLLLIFAAGNNNNLPPEKIPPASLAKEYDNLISVGAVNQELDKIYTTGAGVSIYAPGLSVWSARSYRGMWEVFDEPYDFSSGTSYAAPFVTGTAGLMLSVNPELTPGEVKEILQETSKAPHGSTKKNGILDAEKAVERALKLR